ncbi:MAG: hypothetical protein Q9M92_01960 [Enterobacterales bacterium]|nr:hypothetical protein [Enterobacterales bacterium]
MAIKRSELIDDENAGYYHLMSRCVRRTFLCGKDKETGRSYEHRRQWIENRILELANVFAIEVYAYAVMSNHYHLVVYFDPKAPYQWTNLEVAERWLKAYPGKLDKPKYQQQRDLKLEAIVNNPKILSKIRNRLGSLSWLMSRINEPIAKMSNQEDFVSGHFWESRFKSQALLDEAALLTCMAYVDLNPIRANMTKTLEESDHTSIQKRVRNMTEEQLNQAVKSLSGEIKNRSMVLKLKDYIELVEWSGKSIAYPNKSKMPAYIESTLAHLNLQPNQWLGQVQHFGTHQGYFVGKLILLQQKAEELKKKWLKGFKTCRKLII